MKKINFHKIFKSAASSISEHIDDLESGMKARRTEFIRSRELNTIEHIEPMYIYKPKRLILSALQSQFFRFLLLTVISFDLIIWFIIPVWSMVLYEYYIILKWLGKFNISAIKITLISIFAEILFILISPFIRSAIWFIISGIRV